MAQNGLKGEKIMKIYNQSKTQELNDSELDYENGYLKSDKLFITHHDAIIGKPADKIAQELMAQGIVCNLRADGNWYKQVKVYENGGTDEEEIKPIKAVEAYDEYEDIQVYVPYTAQEIEERRLETLRSKRVSLLTAFDKWEKAVLRGRELDDEAVMQWYQDLLDLKESAFENVPARVKYYL